ncbi:transglutaminase superfamily protein [Lacibacter cauensis]|uniref:Transglutaminase superfamily protein n=1 Tax=Lacibacter cauensis TaxID=510947 RepID=A0A562SWA9_9BACT|nr:transglutaminase family protein [Lacibacter cauensis]TWI85587.1 transglutaminase superfamily protein [Lacibacter cauensis]
MEQTKEITALLHLIDDPDSEVYSTVSEKIISLGKQIIPNLEHLWENTPDEYTQERIEMLIHSLHYRDLQVDFNAWANDKEHDLFTGALLVSRYQYPDLNLASNYQDLEKIRRNVWLELNSFLTALEKVNVLNNIIFNYYKVKGVEINYNNPDEFLLHKLLESKKGNAISIGMLLLSLSHMLDINLYMINIPRQFILAYFDDEPSEIDNDFPPQHIQFYMDGATGQIFSHKDVETYFKRINLAPSASYFKPLENKQVVARMIEEYARCFDNEKNNYKKQDLLSLASQLNNSYE